MQREQPEATATKERWRAWASGVDHSRLSDAVTEHLAAWPPLHGVVAAYLAMPTEIDLGRLFGREGCTFTVPRVESASEMSLRRLEPDRLETHRLGFRQPSPDAAVVDPGDLDVVLVPGLAFDRAGGRLGRGRGYYDRLLRDLPPTTVRIGVTTSETFVDAVPMDEHDERVDWVVTETGMHHTGVPLAPENERVVDAAVAAGIAPRIHRYPQGTRTSKDAARAVGCELGAIAKSLVFEVDDRPVLVLCSGDHRVDEAALAAVLGGSSARPATRERVLEITGFEAGGTPAFGHASELDVVADRSLARYRWVWTAGGTTDAVFPVSIELLIAAGRAQWEEITIRG